MRISDWSSDVCSSDLDLRSRLRDPRTPGQPGGLSRHGRQGGADLRRIWRPAHRRDLRSEEHTSELQSLMRISYAVFCLKKKNIKNQNKHTKYKQITHY